MDQNQQLFGVVAIVNGAVVDSVYPAAAGTETHTAIHSLQAAHPDAFIEVRDLDGVALYVVGGSGKK